jgi:transposase
MRRASGRFTTNTAQYWLQRWRGCLPPPADAEQRAHRLTRDRDRYRHLRVDIDATDLEIVALLADTDVQILTTLPGVASIRAAAFAAHSLPIERFPDAEHLYSATGLAPALYQSATLHRRGRISRQGLAEHRDALLGIAWGLSQRSPAFAERDAELRARGMARSRPASHLHATHAAWHTDYCEPNNPSMNSAIVEAQRRTVTAI